MPRIRSFLDERREALAASPADVNGIAGIDVDPADFTRLTLRFVKPLPGAPGGVPAVPLTAADIVVSGGDRVRGITVTDVQASGDALAVTVDRAGDFSTYRLAIAETVAGFDPILRVIDFRFLVHCDTDLDCEDPLRGDTTLRDEPRLDYMARDYDSYRRMILDRMAVTVPDMTERNAASLEITLVEWLAHLGDELSYRRDLVDTEYSLATARLRRSAARHARLVGYRMHNGVSARVLARVEIDPAIAAPVVLGRRALAFLTRATDLSAPVIAPHRLPEFVAAGARVFEPCHDMRLHAANNAIGLHHWGDPDAILGRGAREAVLRDPAQALALGRGDLLILAQTRDPDTGRAADADPALRHAVRLTDDPVALVDPLEEVAPGVALPVLRVGWGPEDALPFDLCIGRQPAGEPPLALAWGNIVVAEHGHTLPVPDDLGTPPSPVDPELPPAPGQPDELKTLAELDRPRPFAPLLARRDLSFTAGLFDTGGSLPAARIMALDPGEALAAMYLEVDGEAAPWLPLRDLLGAGPLARVFVPEVDTDGTTRLRFGQGHDGGPSPHGRTPAEGQRFRARYRVGTGSAGNIGADALAHVVADEGTAASVRAVRNPLPAGGGADRETVAEVRQRAPVSFLRQRRAVTLADYEALLDAHPDVQRAHARKRWLGSWSAIFLSVDRTGGLPVDDAFRRMLLDYLEPFRMMGHDLAIGEPVHVPLALALRVCVAADHFADDVARALRDLFSAGITARGTRGFFHPDNITFGAEIHVSRIYAAALAVEGVDDMTVRILRRASAATGPDTPAESVLRFGPREIPILSNDPNRPEDGTLTIETEGGR